MILQKVVSVYRAREFFLGLYMFGFFAGFALGALDRSWLTLGFFSLCLFIIEVIRLSGPTTDRERFNNLLAKPELVRLREYWPDGELKIERARQALDVLTPSEAHMLRFMVGVWLGRNEFDFDLIEAARVLDERLLAIIRCWQVEPFYP